VEITPEETNATLAHHEPRWYVRINNETNLGVLVLFVCSDVFSHRTVDNVADVVFNIGRCNTCFGDIPWPRCGACNCQTPRTAPINLYAGKIFDARHLDLEKIVRDGIADVYIRVVWIRVPVLVPAREVSEKRVVLVFALVEMV
jgi:hypothetical protein